MSAVALWAGAVAAGFAVGVGLHAWLARQWRGALPDWEPSPDGVLGRLPDGVLWVSREGSMLAANPAAGALFGLTRDALLGAPIRRYIAGWPEANPAEPATLECELVPPVGRRVPVAVSIVPAQLVRSVDGASLVLVRDLREVAALRSRLVISGRLAAVGALSAGIAHEINNPIAFVVANLGILPKHWAWLRERATERVDLPESVRQRV
ncbi:MAG: hypothetical protein MJE66_15810, partial [Proteobacteria bacterium]|nr:hypothetical protein [Pseudomonadota bacterium]